MEELDLKEMFSYFWGKKLYIILFVLVALIFGIIYTNFMQVPKYQSYTTILLTKEGDSSSITTTDINLNRNLVDTYREIIKSKKVLNRVINNLNLDYDFDYLYKNVSVSSVNDTEIIKVLVTDLDSRRAMDIANEIASVFNSEVVKLYSIQNIGVVDRAEEAKLPYNVQVFKQIVIALLVGIILGLLFVFVLFYFDNTVKGVEEIETKLGIPVIGTIPEMVGGRCE